MTSHRGESRREFLQRSAGAAALLAGVDVPTLVAALPSDTPGPTTPQQAQPWYRRTLRWGQTNIRESDVQQYDVAWWRQYWKRTQTQGVIINAGGIVAYYPSKFPLHRRAEGLGDRDLFGELTRAAHDDGLVVLARMDSNRAHEDFHRAHPDWFAVDAEGRPYRNTDLYVACVNSPYYDEYIPSVLREIVERSRPEGFTDNNWAGLSRDNICHCANCARKFREKTAKTLPRVKNWDDPVYRQWIDWNYARRLEIWDLFNRTTREAGGPTCLWLGMNSGSVSSEANTFRDLKAICERSEIVMLDHQFRGNSSGFQSNGDAGKLVHGLLGWDKVVPESMAMYQAGATMFRLASKPAPEARLWMLDGFAGGIQPWWHHVGAYHEDRRMFETAEPVMRWHAEHQQFLINRRPVASVGVVWSQRNTDFYGRDTAEDTVELPRRGWMNALVRARVPYVLVNADHIARDASQLSVLVLPDLGAMTETQLGAVRRFVQNGGHLVATGDTSRYTEWGDPRSDFALADIFGTHVINGAEPKRRSSPQTQHTYLRLVPELRARVDGPRRNDEPMSDERHPIFTGFEKTDIIPYGGVVEGFITETSTRLQATFVPAFPTFPPEAAYMREPRTTLQGLILNEFLQSRVAFLPADLDRRYARDNLPDHGTLLSNLVRWAAGDSIPLYVEGPGFIDCHLYRQDSRLVLHLVNLTNAGTWRAPVDELISVGPLTVTVRPPAGKAVPSVRLLVAKKVVKGSLKQGWLKFEIPKVLDHEVVVIT
jgi:hypothetical protein